jgi:ATP-binding cassette subfamily C protein/ATP-binding cassette subfamily C protein LapB
MSPDTSTRFTSPEPLAIALRDNTLGAFHAASDYAACLMPLLTALGWRGSHRDVAEALPHFADTLDLVDLRNALVTLGYESQPERVPLDEVETRLMPCLFVPDQGGAMVLVAQDHDRLQVFDGRKNRVRRIAPTPLPGTVYYFTDTGAVREAAARPETESWFSQVSRRFRGTVASLFGVTLVINLLALAVPLFIMVVYDKVIGARSLDTLWYMIAGIAVALAADMTLRTLRARVIGALAGRLDYILGAEAMRQILSLAPAYTERSTVGAQIARLKQFEQVRDFFTGPLASVVIELPFIVLFIAVIAIIGGPVALVPVVMIVCFVLFGWFWLPRLREAVAQASVARAERQSFLVETLGHLRAIKAAAAEPTWQQRYRVLSANAVMTSFKTSQRSMVLFTVAHALMMLAGIAVLGIGTLEVLHENMSLGALIATMALVWRVLSPLQAGFLAFSRLEQVQLSIRQLNRLMQLPPERKSSRPAPLIRRFHGHIAFNRVSFRYSGDGDPALLGVTFEVRPGEQVALAGSNGSGKSTILKLAASLYQPQAGTVAIDGLDNRQIDPVELRRSIAYVPQTPHLFHGTVAQNIRLADPTASDEQLAKAAAEAGVLHNILELPEGFDTRIGDNTIAHLPFGMIQRLVIARAMVREAPILLLDEPATSLDQTGDHVLMDLLRRLRGRTTILMVSHRPSHIRLADRVIVLDQGAITFVGPPLEALAAMREKAAS